MNERKRYIDYTKGFAIILLLLSHALVGEGIVKTWIFSFHMPIFFIICGILTYMKYPNGISKGEIVLYFKKRLFQLGVPYIIFCLLLTVFYSFLSIFSGSELRIADYVVRIITLQGVDSLWFIPCYFIAEAIFTVVVLKINKYLRMAICMCVFIILCFTSHIIPEFVIVKQIVKVLVCVVFVYLGYLIAKFDVIKRCQRVVVCIVVIFVCAVLSYINGFAAIGLVSFGIVPLFYFNATFTSIAFLSLFNIIEVKTKSKLFIFDYFGKNSIVVLCTNNLLIEIIRLTDHFVTGDFLLRAELGGEMLLFGILIICELPIILLSNSRFGVIFGKKQLKQIQKI